VRELGWLVRITDARRPPYRLAPGLGEHSEEILAQFGALKARIAALAADGVIRSPRAMAPSS